MLTSSELDDLRSDVLATLPDTCVIQTLTRATDDAGNVSETYATGATVACRLDPIKQKDGDGLVAAAERATVYFMLTLAWNTTIAHGQRVVHGGRTYEIVQMHDDHSLRIVKRATVAHIQGA